MFYLIVSFIPSTHLPSSCRSVADLPPPAVACRLRGGPSVVPGRAPLRGSVPGPGAVCGRRRCLHAGAASSGRVPGEAGGSSVQTLCAGNLQVPARLPARGAVSAHLLEGSPAPRSVCPPVSLSVCRARFNSLEILNLHFYWNI